MGIPCVFQLKPSPKCLSKDIIFNKLVPFWQKLQIPFLTVKKPLFAFSLKYEKRTLWILDMLLPIPRVFSTYPKIQGARGGKTTFGLFSKIRAHNRFIK